MGRVTLELDMLFRVKELFEDMEDECPDGIGLDEFIDKFGPLLGEDMSRLELAQLFMKIDADANGNIDWDEFSNYMFLDNKNDGAVLEEWKLMPHSTFKAAPLDPGSCHRAMCEAVTLVPAIDKYISGSTDGVFKIWDAQDLSLHKTYENTNGYITDILWMPVHKKVVMCSIDRSISFYDINHRQAFTCAGRVYANGANGTPMCMATLSGGRWTDSDEGLLFGDSMGVVNLLKEPCSQLSTNIKRALGNKEVVVVNKGHSDWVTRVQYIPEVNSVVSSSLDSTLQLYDPLFLKHKLTITLHDHGVYGFGFCPSHNMCASHGVDRDIYLWHSVSGRKMGILSGHQSSIQSIEVNDKLNQLISVSVDKVIKLWDLRLNKCLQTTLDTVNHRPENRISSTTFHLRRNHFITCATRPYIWPLQCFTTAQLGHEAPVSSALYSPEFALVVSGDSEGMVFQWDVKSGRNVGKFSNESEKKITGMTFDANERRLILSDNDGNVKMFNYNNGALLKVFNHLLERMEITDLAYAVDEQRGSKLVCAVGWNRHVLVWDELEDFDNDSYKTLDGHQDDILCCAYTGVNVLATGDYTGRIIIWNLGNSLKRKEFQHTSPQASERAVEKMIFLHKKKDNMHNTMLVSCGADGWVRLWATVGYHGDLRVSFKGAHGEAESVACLASDHHNAFLVAGDTAGHVRVWDISQIDPNDPKVPKLITVAHWKAASKQISACAVVKGHHLLVVASMSAEVSLWTLEGGKVGVFGQESAWDLEKRATWLDPEARNTEKPESLDDGNDPEKGRGNSRMGRRMSVEDLPLELKVNSRVNQILEQGRQERLRGGKKGFNVEEYMHKKKNELRTHSVDSIPAMAELRRGLKKPNEDIPGLTRFTLDSPRVASSMSGAVTERGGKNVHRLPPLAISGRSGAMTSRY